MKASELIKRIQELIDTHGDLSVVNSSDYEVDIDFSEALLEGQEDAFLVEG